MGSRYVEQLNKLFSIYDEIRKSHIQEVPVAPQMLSDALSQSCVLLTDLLKQPPFNQEKGKLAPPEDFLEFLNSCDYGSFLDAESRMLRDAGASPVIAEVLLNDARKRVGEKRYSSEETLAHVTKLKEQVCTVSPAILKNAKRESVVKRVIRMAGGGVIVVLDYLSPVGLHPPVREASMWIGGQIMGSQASEALKMIMGKVPRPNSPPKPGGHGSGFHP